MPKQRTDSKLQRFIDRDQDRGYKMLKTLAFISNMFADARDLETKYGIHLKHRDQVSTATVELGSELTTQGLASPYRRENSDRSKECRSDPEKDGQSSATYEYSKEMSLSIGRDRQIRHIHRTSEGVHCNPP